MIQYNNKTVFKKMIDVIDGNYLNKIVKKYDSDYRIQHFDTRSHVISMIYLQLSNSSGLRGLIDRAKYSTKIKNMVNVPSVSQLSRKNSGRTYEIFEDLYSYLLYLSKRKVGYRRWSEHFNKIKIIDGTIIQLASSLVPQLEYKNGKSGIKVTTLLELSTLIPEKLNISLAKVNDRKCVDNLFIDKESLYLFDRGYSSHRLYDELTDKNYGFITRQVSNARVEKISSITDEECNLIDCKILLGKKDKRAQNIYREITFNDEDNGEIKILTNIFDIQAKEIINLYKLRWNIEIFFKWIKQNLKIKKWIGYNENAVRIQIYSALIAYILLLMLSLELKNKLSLTSLFRIIQINLLEYVEVLTILSG